MLADQIGVVDVFGRIEFEEGIVVDVIVKASGAHAEAGDDFAVVEGFLCAGDSAAFDEVDNPVAEHFGVDAEVFFVFEVFGQRLRDSSDAALDGAAVFDEAGDVLADAAHNVVGFRDGDFDDLLVKGDEQSMELTWMKAVAEGSRHAGIDLGDDVFGVGGGGLDDIDGDAEGAQAVDVGRGYGNKGDIERDSAAFELAGNFGQEDRRIVANAFARGRRGRCRR